MSDMGERIRQKRIELGLSLEELGKMLGVQKTAVSKWELGAVENIKRNTIEQMASIFRCSPAWLMGFDNKEEREPAWMAAFSGAGEHDPRVQAFMEYLGEQAEKEKASGFSQREMLIIERYRTAGDKVQRAVDYMLEMPSEGEE